MKYSFKGFTDKANEALNFAISSAEYMGHIRITRKKGNQLQILVRAKTTKREYVTVENMANFLSEYFKRPLIAQPGGRRYITCNMADFLIEERPNYFTMTGVRAFSKNSADISGDAYSCINNQSGKIELLEKSILPERQTMRIFKQQLEKSIAEQKERLEETQIDLDEILGEIERIQKEIDMKKEQKQQLTQMKIKRYLQLNLTYK